MKLVSENSEAELVKRRAEEEVGYAVRELAANLMRMIRGAGKPNETGKQANRLVQAYRDYQEAVDHWPPSELLTGALELYPYDETRERPAADPEIQHAKEQIVHGALQVAASKLLDQPLQIRAGEDQIDRGIKLLEHAREERRKRWLAELPQRPQEVTKLKRKLPKI